MRKPLWSSINVLPLTDCRFYDLVALPDFAPELREEAASALEDNNGVLTSNALQSMKKMDSFLKEALRISPASMGQYT